MTEGYRAAIESTAIVDRSTTGKVLVSGPDAPKFLTNLSTNDLRDLPLGGGCETYFLDHKAKTLFAAWAYHVLSDGKHAIWLETTPGRGAKLFAHLDRYLISESVELHDVTDRLAQFHLAGPTATATLEAALADRIPDLAEFQHMERTFGRNIAASIRRRNLLGTAGYDLLVPVEQKGAIADLLVAAGATTATAEDFEILRIEAGTPTYGPDIDETRFVMELPRVERAVNYAKGCFIGQEPIVMARDRAGFVNRAFLKLKTDGDPLPPGTKLTRDGQDAGVVTSSTRSPRYGTIALGYIRRGHQDPGTVLAAGSQSVEVIGSPA
ncbi:MAG: aminomethyltransferase family protein [Gemmataceae bacterium]|nr:aminomethyltransferase family protein [Gemmataceae bacterium]